MEDPIQLEKPRIQIAQITRDIIRLAGKRQKIAREVGLVKRLGSLPIESAGVEDALVQEVISECDKVGLERTTGLRILAILLEASKKAQGMKESTSQGSIFGRVLGLERKGVRLIRLDIGEPDFHPPRAVLRACSNALFSYKTRYTEPRGIPELRAALAKHLRRKYGFEAADEDLAITPSGRFAVYAALSAVVGQGGSALVIEPNWPAYRDSLKQLGARATVVHTSLEEGWMPSIESIHESIRPDTKAIILSYPNNPTGKIVSKNLFGEMVGLADDLGLTVISDEIYNDYASRPCPSILSRRPRKFVLTSSFSKTWSMTGFRIGFAVSSAETISKISDLTSLIVTSVPEFIQWGAIKALGAESEVRRNVTTMHSRVNAACGALDSIPSLEYSRPDGAMYVFPRLKSEESGEVFAERLLSRGVSVTPGVAFGDYQHFFRISLGRHETEIVRGIQKIGESLT